VAEREAPFCCPFCTNKAHTSEAIYEHVMEEHFRVSIPCTGSTRGIWWGECWCGYRIDYGRQALYGHWDREGGLFNHVLALTMGVDDAVHSGEAEA
jgi:hypothetical protein